MIPTIFSSSVVRCLGDKLSRLQGLQLAGSRPALRSFRVCGKANWRNCGSSSQVQRGLGIALRERSNIVCSRRPVSGQGGDTRKRKGEIAPRETSNIVCSRRPVSGHGGDTRKIEKMTGGKEVSNKQVLFKEYVDEGWPTESTMEVVTVTKKLELKEGSKEVLVKVLYLSCDPYMRGRMRNIESYIPPFKPGQPMSGYGIGKVVLSNDPKFVENDYVEGILTWEEYCVGFMLQKIDVTSIPLTYWLGALGMPGFTAYAGLFDIGKPKKGETVYVSAAAGAVGQMVGQFAKLAGCYVVGSAGSQQKIDLLKEKFKYDDAFNYKEEPDLDAALKRCCPKGIDIYFENVGGKMLDAVLLNVNVFARIIVCGMISQYNLANHEGIFNLGNIVKKRVLVRGFLQSDHLQLKPEFQEKVLGWFKEKKLEYVEDIADGLEEGPKAILAVLSGKNVGKQSIKVADDV